MLNYLRRLAQNFSHQYILNYLRLQFDRQTPGKGGMGRRVFHHQHNPRSPAFGWRCPCSFANKNFPPRPRAPGFVNDQINWQNHSSGMDIYLTLMLWMKYIQPGFISPQCCDRIIQPLGMVCFRSAVLIPTIPKNLSRVCMLLLFGKRALNDEHIPMIDKFPCNLIRKTKLASKSHQKPKELKTATQRLLFCHSL